MDYGNYGEGGFSNDNGYSDTADAHSQRQQNRTSLTPVTIRQINQATQHVPDGEFFINNVSLNMVSFVGVLRKVENQTSAVIVTIEDGTGSVEVKRWVDEKVTSAAEETEQFQALENSYVYVTGALKEFNQKKAIQHAKISPITDHNEVIYHMFYAISSHLEAQGLLNVGAIKTESGGIFASGDSTGTGGDGLDIQDKIMGIITSNSLTMPEGVPISWISGSLGVSVEKIQEKCQYLAEQGKIYQGYDEGAYLCV
ncbi:replication protein A, subunit RPA32 [Metschnikowia bicuspidata]|uniref:Replication protein A, subunit RPA32 n=1 Tax=Metschnikowia bicuspidata TaxID=27322 RepID=A0A4P9ZIA1_9ASCO|nr:replication protein A, subunit RPA32 [Metschnikowia bicuspidata]